MSRHPFVKWAQTSDKIYITIELPDAKDVELKLLPEGKFTFSATKDEVPYEVDLELFGKIKEEESQFNVGVRTVACAIQKEEKKWWDRLLIKEGKPPAFLKIDWDKWVDEDEENEKPFNIEDTGFSEKMKKMQPPKKSMWQQAVKRLRRGKNPLNQWLRRLRLDCLRK